MMANNITDVNFTAKRTYSILTPKKRLIVPQPWDEGKPSDFTALRPFCRYPPCCLAPFLNLVGPRVILFAHTLPICHFVFCKFDHRYRRPSPVDLHLRRRRLSWCEDDIEHGTT